MLIAVLPSSVVQNQKKIQRNFRKKPAYLKIVDLVKCVNFNFPKKKTENTTIRKKVAFFQDKKLFLYTHEWLTTKRNVLSEKK